jgi:hypothetical protein
MARSVRSTRYAMLGAKFIKNGARRAGATAAQILKPLPTDSGPLDGG